VTTKKSKVKKKIAPKYPTKAEDRLITLWLEDDEEVEYHEPYTKSINGGVCGAFRITEFKNQKEQTEWLSILDERGTFHFDIPSSSNSILNVFKRSMDAFISNPTPETLILMSMVNLNWTEDNDTVDDSLVGVKFGCFCTARGDVDKVCKHCDYRSFYKSTIAVCTKIGEACYSVSKDLKEMNYNDTFDFDNWLDMCLDNSLDLGSSCSAVMIALTIQACAMEVQCQAWTPSRPIGKKIKKGHRDYLNNVIPLVLPHIMCLRTLLENPPSMSIFRPKNE